MSIERIENLERQLEALHHRNARVELEKAWEGSLFRQVCISIITYFAAATVLYLIGVEKYWLSALIPTIGFFLSVQSLPFIKRHWAAKKYQDRDNLG